MAYTTTRAERADRSRKISAFVALAAVSAVGLLSLPVAVPALAQVKAPAKNYLKAPSKANAQSPTDNQADSLNEQWLKEHGGGGANVAAPATPAAPTAKVEDVSAAGTAAMPGAGARTLVSGSVKLVSAKTAAAGFLPGGANNGALKPLSDAFAGFGASPKVELVEGRTADGSTRLLYASIGDGKSKKSYWWFTPIDQPEGWFDEAGKRLGDTMLSEPKPDSRISSPFGNRRYYGRKTGGGFHDGIDFEGKVGEPIHAAADGVINHQGWYYQYGRTVKITHADNFETLYAHMSNFETSLAPGSRVKKGDVIGYVGSTGRSTGPHLHFSVIAGGHFVDPQPYLSRDGGHGTLAGQSLVAYRQWQQDVRTASAAQRSNRSNFWSQNPFSGSN